MDEIHQDLMKQSSWYRRWHESRENIVLMWMVFLLYAVATTVVISTNIPVIA